MTLDIGQVLGGRYTVERLIGRGVLGSVYQGRDQSTSRHVAIRLIQPEFDNEQVAAFTESEVRTVGQLADTRIARLVNIGFLPTGERCVLTEYVEGETLKSRVARLGRIPELQVTHVLMQVLEGLAASHKAGVSHRDLTPNSVILSPAADDGAERATLIDFGISRLQALTGVAQRAGIDTTSLQYLSPEQLSGLRDIDPRSNIYSLGAIAYEAVTGKGPFDGRDSGDPAAAVARGEPKPVEELVPESSAPFARLIRKAMARSPNARFQSADEMLAAMRDWLQPSAGNPVSLGGSTRPAAAQASLHAAVSAPVPAPPAGNPISAPPPIPAQVQDVPKPGSTPPQADGSGAFPMVVPPSESSAEHPPASARDRIAPPPPPPTPIDPTAADIDQSVVDALFAPPPVGARDDFGPPDSEQWAAPPTSVSEPKSAPISELQPPKLVQASASGTPKTTDAGPTAPVPPSSPAASGPVPPPGETASAQETTSPHASPSGPDAAPAPARATVEQQHTPEAELAQPATSATGFGRLEPTSETEKRLAPEGAAAQSPSADPPEPLKRTILGIGGVATYPAGAQGAVNVQETVGPPSQRPPQATAPGIHPENLAVVPEASATGSSALAPPAESPPASTTAAGAAPVSSRGGSESNTDGALPAAATSQVPSTLAAAVSPSSKPADAMIPSSVSTSPPKPEVVTPVAAAAIMDTADDLGPYGKARSRSRRPLAIAILLVGLVGGGAALALLQSHSDGDVATKPDASQVGAPVPPRADLLQSKPSTAPSADSRERPTSKETSGEPTRSGTSLSQAVNGSLSQSVAAVQGKKTLTTSTPVSKPVAPDKSASPGKAATSAKPPAVSKPTTKASGSSPTPNKPVAPKGASKDPYNYR